VRRFCLSPSLFREFQICWRKFWKAYDIACDLDSPFSAFSWTPERLSASSDTSFLDVAQERRDSDFRNTWTVISSTFAIRFSSSLTWLILESSRAMRVSSGGQTVEEVLGMSQMETHKSQS
jgi:hypothetical protein